MDFPLELQEKMVELHTAIQEISTVMQNALETSPQETRDKLEPLEKAKFDLVCAYVLNSLFWMYLNTKGENPQSHGIKQELERVQSYMTKVRQLMDKVKAPKLDVGTANRLLRHSLWTPKDKAQQSNPPTTSDVEVIEEISSTESPKKRNRRQIKSSRKKQKKK